MRARERAISVVVLHQRTIQRYKMILVNSARLQEHGREPHAKFQVLKMTLGSSRKSFLAGMFS